MERQGGALSFPLSGCPCRLVWWEQCCPPSPPSRRDLSPGRRAGGTGDRPLTGALPSWGQSCSPPTQPIFLFSDLPVNLINHLILSKSLIEEHEKESYATSVLYGLGSFILISCNKFMVKQGSRGCYLNELLMAYTGPLTKHFSTA